MSESLPDPQPSQPAERELLPKATPQPGEASAAVERRRSRSATAADASLAAPLNASAQRADFHDTVFVSECKELIVAAYRRLTSSRSGGKA